MNNVLPSDASFANSTKKKKETHEICFFANRKKSTCNGVNEPVDRYHIDYKLITEKNIRKFSLRKLSFLYTGPTRFIRLTTNIIVKREIYICMETE